MKSIMGSEKGVCYLCQKNGLYARKDTECHHVFGGGNRGVCDEDGVTVHLCRRHHHLCHNGSQSAKLRYMLHKEGERKWIEVYGPDILRNGGDPIEEFMKRYGRNYL